MPSYQVRIASAELTFAAAHFITLESDVCERLHGHDYHLAAEVRGPLGDEGFVIDFVAVRDALRTILAELDHRILLPTGHRAIQVSDDRREIEVRFADRRWVFPREECVLLPLENTTSELLALHVGERLREALESLSGESPEFVRIEVAEGNGFTAVCEL